MECVNSGSMLCVTDEHNNVVGVALGKDNMDKTFYVYDVLCIQPWVLKTMLSEFIIRYPNYFLVGLRHGKDRKYSPNQLIERIS